MLFRSDITFCTNVSEGVYCKMFIAIYGILPCRPRHSSIMQVRDVQVRRGRGQLLEAVPLPRREGNKMHN